MIPMIFGVVALCFAAHSVHHERRPDKCPKQENHHAGYIKTEPCPKECIHYADNGRVKRDSNGDRVA